MPFLPPNQQRQSTEGRLEVISLLGPKFTTDWLVDWLVDWLNV